MPYSEEIRNVWKTYMKKLLNKKNACELGPGQKKCKEGMMCLIFTPKDTSRVNVCVCSSVQWGIQVI